MAWVTPRTWVAGETVTASICNTHIRDNLNAIGASWTSYTPVAGAGLTQGNGTLTGAYMQAGKMVTFRLVLTLGTTSTITGNITLTVPATPIASDQSVSAVLIDASAGAPGRLVGAGRIPSSSTAMQVYGPGGSFTATVPFTWASTDQIFVTGTYEAA